MFTMEYFVLQQHFSTKFLFFDPVIEPCRSTEKSNLNLLFRVNALPNVSCEMLQYCTVFSLGAKAFLMQLYNAFMSKEL